MLEPESSLRSLARAAKLSSVASPAFHSSRMAWASSAAPEEIVNYVLKKYDVASPAFHSSRMAWASSAAAWISSSL